MWKALGTTGFHGHVVLLDSTEGFEKHLQQQGRVWGPGHCRTTWVGDAACRFLLYLFLRFKRPWLVNSSYPYKDQLTCPPPCPLSSDKGLSFLLLTHALGCQARRLLSLPVLMLSGCVPRDLLTITHTYWERLTPTTSWNPCNNPMKWMPLFRPVYRDQGPIQVTPLPTYSWDSRTGPACTPSHCATCPSQERSHRKNEACAAPRCTASLPENQSCCEETGAIQRLDKPALLVSEELFCPC